MKHDRTGKFLSAATIMGKRSAKLYPFRVKSRALGVPPRQDAEAVVFDLVNPAWPGRRLLRGARQAGLERTQGPIGWQSARSSRVTDIQQKYVLCCRSRVSGARFVRLRLSIFYVVPANDNTPVRVRLRRAAGPCFFI
jgi:hypothetical protein